jgi:hypothetical protein
MAEGIEATGMVLEIAETEEGVARESVAGTTAILASGAMASTLSARLTRTSLLLLLSF